MGFGNIVASLQLGLVCACAVAAGNEPSASADSAINADRRTAGVLHKAARYVRWRITSSDVRGVLSSRDTHYQERDVPIKRKGARPITVAAPLLRCCVGDETDNERCKRHVR